MKKQPQDIEDIARRLLEAIGENPKRAGLTETPSRVARAWKEWTAGYGPFPHALKLFPSHFDGIIARKGIPFASTCEHHLAHYSGTIDFGYIPNKNVLGISKIIRLIQHYSARLTIQEGLTSELVKRFEDVVRPKGTIVKITGYHSCEYTRGVNVANVPTVTFLATGVFKKDGKFVSEFFNLIGEPRV